MKTFALDANCFINAVNPASRSYPAVRSIFRAAEKRRISLAVSLQTLHELARRQDEAWELANSQTKLPHWSVGSWDEQVGTWEQEEGSWADAQYDDAIQLQLKSLANAGTDIRDRGAFIDALRNGLDGFITSDKQLVASGPAARINHAFSTKVLSPEQLATELCE